MITIQDFKKVQMRVGEIIAATKVAGADKLLQLTLDFGDEARTAIAGIALCYDPNDLVGRRVIAVTNLEPAVIRGVRSDAMILASGDEQDLSLVVSDPGRPGPKGAAVL
ncbi:MAG: methionine--tRNA ligase subunit beta [Armatimonadota bacterium]|nr:MAG: methionine--tRNA ligase subunit beta [Armatimonadota bacterium]